MKIPGVVAFLVATSFVASVSAFERQAQSESTRYDYNITDAPELPGLGITIRPVFGAQLPILSNLGISYAEISFEPCGIFLPHTHPRATELGYVVEGSSLQVGLAEEDGGNTVISNISKGVIAVFPQGLLHYEFNNGCDHVKFLAAFNNGNPGLQTYPDALYTFRDMALTTAFGVGRQQIDDLRDAADTRTLRQACLNRCK